MQQNWNWNGQMILFAIEYVAFDCKHPRAVHRCADLRTTLGALKSLHKMGSLSDLLINRFSYSVYIHAKKSGTAHERKNYIDGTIPDPPGICFLLRGHGCSYIG